QQRDILRPLDRHGQPSLMPRTSPRHAPRQNLPAFLNERRQNLRLLVIDEIGFIHAEPATLLLAHEVPLPALRWSARPSSAWTARATAARSRRPHPSRRGAVRLLLWSVFFCHRVFFGGGRGGRPPRRGPPPLQSKIASQLMPLARIARSAARSAQQ